MAIALLAHEVRDLTLGKPYLCGLPSSCSVLHALRLLKQRPDLRELSVWACSAIATNLPLPQQQQQKQKQKQKQKREKEEKEEKEEEEKEEEEKEEEEEEKEPWRCIGKVCMLRLLCFLASDSSLTDLPAALEAPIAAVLHDELRSSSRRLVQRLDPQARYSPETLKP
jgi:flagellar biosynthesis GTPase FlhF